MDIATQEIILGIAFFTTIVIVVFIITRYTYLIRKSMVENGMQTPKFFSRDQLIHIGGILIGLGIGLMISSIFTLFELSENTTDLLIWGTIVIFGGCGLIVAHYLEKKFGG